MEAHIGVAATVSGSLEEGKSYPLYVRGERLQGQLRSVLPEVDPGTRTVTAIFELARNDLPLGAVVELEYEQRVADSGFWLPLSALSTADRGLWSVYVVNNEDVVEASPGGGGTYRSRAGLCPGYAQCVRPGDSGRCAAGGARSAGNPGRAARRLVVMRFDAFYSNPRLSALAVVFILLVGQRGVQHPGASGRPVHG